MQLRPSQHIATLIHFKVTEFIDECHLITLHLCTCVHLTLMRALFSDEKPNAQATHATHSPKVLLSAPWERWRRRKEKEKEQLSIRFNWSPMFFTTHVTFDWWVFFQFQPRDFASSSSWSGVLFFLSPLSSHPSLRIIQFITWAAFNSSPVSCETRNYKTLVTVWIRVHLSHPQLRWWHYFSLSLSCDQDATATEDANSSLLSVLWRPQWITLHVHRHVSGRQVFPTHSRWTAFHVSMFTSNSSTFNKRHSLPWVMRNR